MASRISYVMNLLFSSRQKRFNAEIVAAAGALADDLDAARRDLLAQTAATEDARRTAAALAATVDALRADVSALAATARVATSVDAGLARLASAVDYLQRTSEPPHFRPGTIDQDIWNIVPAEYRLPDRFEATDVIVEVGTHIGGFSFACLQRGVGKVLTFEVMPQNHAVAVTNLARFGSRCEAVNRAVWRSDRPAGRLYFHAGPDPANFGGGYVDAVPSDHEIETVQFDACIDDLLARTGKSRIRMLKLDCEGSEYPILLTSSRLHLIDEIVGEYHEELAPTGDPSPDAADLGIRRRERHVLRERLEANGFTVELVGAADYPMGLFFARQPQQ